MAFGRELRASEAELVALRASEIDFGRTIRGLLEDVKECAKTGDKRGELKAGYRVLDLRERRKSVQNKTWRCLKRIEYFERVLEEP